MTSPTTSRLLWTRPETTLHSSPTQIGVIARSQNFRELARKVGMSRDCLYKALSNNGNPSFANIFKVARVLGLKLEFHAVA